jgi:cytosine/adenosine deaminase-related metal-dependent hydrolase
MKKHDLLINNGYLVDAANGLEGIYDLGVCDGKVAEVNPELNPDEAADVFDAKGKLVFPGLVDTHVHLTHTRQPVGFQMLARAGVTCALDCGGFVDEIIEGMATAGSGISIAVLNRLDPGVSVSGPNATKKELVEYLEKSLKQGAFGLKLLGGHLPLSPETTSAAIEIANQAGVYVAFHCGTTENGSNLNGMLEALELAGSNRLQVCHVTAYCRGLTHGSPVAEILSALENLAARPHVVSESYFGPYNGTSARLENDMPRSHVTRTCLETGGYEASKEGMLAAAKDGHMLVQKETACGVIYLEPDDAQAHLKSENFKVTVSFPVNHRSTALLAATEKDDRGRFIIPALSTDGGAIPRNFLLSHGLSLVRFDALTLSELVHKCCRAPARMLGLPNKGHLTPGADADIVVADPNTHKAVLTVANGNIIMIDGLVTGSGGTIITTENGMKVLQNQGVPAKAADLAASLFYNAPEN